MHDLKLQLILEAQDRASRVLEKVDARQKAMGSSATKAAATSGASWVTASKQSSAAILLTASAAERATEKAEKMARAIERTGRASDQVERAARHTRNWADQMERVGQKGAMAGAAITAASALALRASMEQEKARASAQNAFSTVNGLDGNWAEINRQAVAYGNVFPGTTGDYLQLATALKETGMATEVIEKGAFKGAAALKVLFDLAPSDAGQQMGALMKAYGVEGKDASAFADLLQRQKYATGMSLQEISTAAPYIGSKLAAYDIRGLDAARQTAIVMGVLKQSNLEGSMIGTAFGSFLDRAATVDARSRHLRGGVNQEAFGVLEKKGIHMDFFDRAGRFQGLPNAVAQLEKLKGLSQQERKLVMSSLFGQEGERMSLVDPAKWTAVSQALQQQEAIEARLARVTDTLAAKWEAVGGSASNAADRWADKLKPVLIPLLEKANGLLDRIGKWADAHPRLAALIGGTVVATGALLTVTGGLLWVTGKLWLGLKEGMLLFGGMRTAIHATTVATEANTAATAASQAGLAGMAKGLGMVAAKAALVLVALKLVSEAAEGVEKTFKSRDQMEKDVTGATEKARRIRPILESHDPSARAAYFRSLDMRNDVDARAERQARAYERGWQASFRKLPGDLQAANEAGEAERFREERRQMDWADKDMKHPFRRWFGWGGKDEPEKPLTYSPTYNISGAQMGPEELKKLLRQHSNDFLGMMRGLQVSEDRGAFA